MHPMGKNEKSARSTAVEAGKKESSVRAAALNGMMAKYEEQTLIGKGAIYISQLTYLYNRLIINSYCYFPPSSLFRCKNHKSLCKLLFYAVCCNGERLTLFAALLKSKQTKKRRSVGRLFGE
jgi:hypothetical protein